MSLRGAAYIAGAFEHPGRELPDKSVAQIHAEVALGALADAGLSVADVDGYFCGRDAPGAGGVSMADYLGLRLTHMDSTESGGASPIYHVGHAAAAIAAGKCSVALITLGGRSRTGSGPGGGGTPPPEDAFEVVFGSRPPLANYALAARRHMYEYGTTSAQLAAVKVAAATHARHNPNAFLRKEITVEDVLASPLVADPLHRDDCCVVTDGGGALVVVSPEIARELPRAKAKVLGHGEAPKYPGGRPNNLTFSGAVYSAPIAFAEAGLTPGDIDMVSLYDSFTITVIEQLEDLGFCAKGEGGRFVEDGTLLAGGKLPFNTDGGSLANNHPVGRGGMTRVIEAVRQLRDEANPGTQLADCQVALVNGTGGELGTRMRSATLILGREDA